jgi:Cu/Ag efflux protein CusF
MPAKWYLTPFFLAVALSCTKAREYPLKGQVLAVNADSGEIAVKHEDIQGLMPAMTMTFTVEDRAVLTERVPGDLIEATLLVTERQAALRGVRKVGFSKLSPPAAAAAATSGFELLKPGEPVPDQAFVDERGQSRRLSDWRGRAVALTFIYTRCPIPTFCPLMDRHFAAVQKTIQEDRSLNGRVQSRGATGHLVVPDRRARRHRSLCGAPGGERRTRAERGRHRAQPADGGHRRRRPAGAGLYRQRVDAGRSRLDGA